MPMISMLTSEGRVTWGVRLVNMVLIILMESSHYFFFSLQLSQSKCKQRKKDKPHYIENEKKGLNTDWA